VKVYTRGGDRGETSLFGGERVRKDEPRVEAYGAVDELNAAIGVAIAELAPESDLRERLLAVQSSLFDLGGELATRDAEARAAQGKPMPRVRSEDVTALERAIDALDRELEPLRAFVLPGGTHAAAALHLARTVCRRAERRVVALAGSAAVAPVVIEYLNRLSDYLFTAARVANARQRVPESVWIGRER
jgi:cob(I)alamin adenosyltransferase